ncbi:sugar phosphorylase [Gynuella sunshinyii]|uniref:Glycosidase n=1 Tax=Gynuella sunshinyii YC6258 TaxID=1445510 RepID=A0A0C5VQL8_9GAMM|nr:sugar phosphorylase [Gynuella sunshinyii]AJQ96556.1 glycosidase [Gynuella sunshinyii YC6258]
MRNPLAEQLHPLVKLLYPNRAEEVCQAIINLIVSYQARHLPTQRWVNQRDAVLITYGDTLLREGQKPLRTLYYFLTEFLGDTINSVHILPCFPYTSDDGFSVADYKQINPELGDWDDIAVLASEYDLMFDAVINHISRWSYWFRRYVAGDPDYQDFFIEADPKQDYSSVTRPRALPLLTPVDTSNGIKHLWTTFSDDQIDLNYRNPKVMLAILDVLCLYAEQGARFIRLDAIGFLWKQLGTSCMHLPETHAAIQLMRVVMDNIAPGTILITETNVPHKDNISYFGNGYNEAKMVYQFPLPPLVMHSFLTRNSDVLSRWAGSLAPISKATTFFNFLASHDGIGMRPAEGLLNQEQINALVDHCIEQNGRVSYRDNGDGTRSPYELNITYFDALGLEGETEQQKAQKLITAHFILLSLAGVPAIYIHSLFGTTNDVKAVENTGINRRINRSKLSAQTLKEELSNPDGIRSQIFKGITQLIQKRKRMSALAPQADQKILLMDPRIFAVERYNSQTGGHVLCLCNLSNDVIELTVDFVGRDMISGKRVDFHTRLEAYGCQWIKSPNEIQHRKVW